MLMMLLIISTMNFANEKNNYNFIQQSPDGRFYLTEDTVIELANYIKQLQELNNNYLEQINNLKEQINNLKQQISNLEEQIKVLESKNLELQKELEAEKLKKTVLTVIATITLGTTIYLFVK